MRATKLETYTLRFDENQLKDLLIKAGLPLSADRPFGFSVNNGQLLIQWTIESVEDIKEGKV